MKNRHPHLSLALALSCATAFAQGQYTGTYNESAPPHDLSNDRSAPTPILTALPGPYLVIATQQGDAAGRDIDYFSVSVPTGFSLVSVRVRDYVGAPNDNAFLGVQAGPVISVDPAAPNPAPLLGGAVYGASDIGTDVLPRMGTLAGAIGFTGPLPAGQYSFWLNQTGAPSTVSLELEIGAQGLGAAYCTDGQPNSTGVVGGLEALGTPSIAANDLRLRAFDLPQQAFGYLIDSRTAGYILGVSSQMRLLCLSGDIGRYYAQVQSTGGTGEVTTLIDPLALPQPNGVRAALAGETWHFQLWHRDVQFGATTSNFTHGWALTFQP